jgi:hypothetical protein
MPTKLKPQEFKKIKDNLRLYCRGMTKHMIEDISKLVFSHEALIEENKALQVKLSAANQLSLMDTIDNPPQPYVAPVKDKWEGVPLPQRIAYMVENMQVDTDLWRIMLLFNGLTHEKALAMYEEWKKNDSK